MSAGPTEPRPRAVPSGRISRLSQFGRLAAGVGGGVLAEGARRLVTGERPRLGRACCRVNSTSGRCSPQRSGTRDPVMTTLIKLVLRELFEFGVMQTDPNFANYRFQPDKGSLVLLDFGAARIVADVTALAYRRILHAGLYDDRAGVREAAVAAGFVSPDAIVLHGPQVDTMIDIILGEMHRLGLFDFGDRRFVGVLREIGTAIAADKAAWHVPPADIVFVQRKISGTALLAARLEARVDVRGLAQTALLPVAPQNT